MEFQINKVICTEFQAKLSPTQQKGLKLPDYVHIRPCHIVKYRHSGLPFIVNNNIIRLPINSENNLMKNKVILQFENNENETKLDYNRIQIESNKTQIESNKTQIDSNKTQIRSNKTQIRSQETQYATENSQSMYNKEKYLKHMNKVGVLYSKITVSGNAILSLNNETLTHMLTWEDMWNLLRSGKKSKS